MRENRTTNTSVGWMFFRERIECGAAASHVEGQDGHGHVELVDGVDDDGGGGEEGEHEQEQEVDQHVAAEPADALHRQVLPGGRGDGDIGPIYDFYIGKSPIYCS